MKIKESANNLKPLINYSAIGYVSILTIVVFGFWAIFNSAKKTEITDSNSEYMEQREVLANTSSTSSFSTGATLTQYSLDSWGDSQAIASGKSLLTNSTSYVAQHVMGFGASNPEVSPNDYDFNTIDRRIGKNAGAAKGADTIVLTACCAPDWMKGGEAGTTDWSTLEKAPFPEYYDDYAELIAEIVSQPEFTNIKYIQVWNEMKGFYDQGLGRWNHEEYTNLYNEVWSAVKTVRPDIKIGGPYVVVTSNGGGKSYDSSVGGNWGTFDQRDLDVVKYWLQNKLGADFISVDGKNSNKDGVELVDAFARSDKYQVFMDWLRGLDNSTYSGAKTLPVWWSEWYARTDNDSTSSEKEKNAVMATGLIKTIKSGANAAFIWGPQGDTEGNSEPLALFTDTRVSGGGQPTLFHGTQKILKEYFSAGVALTDATVSNTKIESIATASKAFVINTKNSQQSGTIQGTTVVLDAYETKLISLNEPEPSDGNSSGSNSETTVNSDPENEEESDNDSTSQNDSGSNKDDNESLTNDKSDDNTKNTKNKIIGLSLISLGFGLLGTVTYIYKTSIIQFAHIYFKRFIFKQG